MPLFLLTSLFVCLSVQCGDVKEAEEVFRTAVKTDLFMYSVMMKGESVLTDMLTKISPHVMQVTLRMTWQRKLWRCSNKSPVQMR